MPTSQTPDATPALSLCMIVRDEAELLPRFLQHAQGLWDELVVVDTGSRDQTRSRCCARRGPASSSVPGPVTSPPPATPGWSWPAAAGSCSWTPTRWSAPSWWRRSNRWSPTARPARPPCRCATCCPTGTTGRAACCGCSATTRTSDFATAFTRRWGRRSRRSCGGRGLQLRHLPGTVLHLGYVRERAQARNKKQRDTELLWRSVGEDAERLLQLVQAAGAGPVLERPPAGRRRRRPAAWRPWTGPGRGRWPGRPFGGELLVLIAAGLHRGRPRAVAALLARWEAGAGAVGRSPSARRRAGRAARAPDEAARRFQRCLELADRTADVQLATVRPLMGLARLALSRPDGLDLAWDFTRQALAFNPRDREALLAALAICRTAGGQPLLDSSWPTTGSGTGTPTNWKTPAARSWACLAWTGRRRPAHQNP